MDVSIGEVQAQVESQTPQAQASSDGNPQMGPTEKAHRARLEQRRAKRIHQRLTAS